MKRTAWILWVLLAASVALGQQQNVKVKEPRSAHNVVLTWFASSDAGVNYNVYRAVGVCAPGLVFSKIASVMALTYTDTTVSPGAYCYQVTAALNGAESAPSNQAGPIVPVAPPSNLSGTAQ